MLELLFLRAESRLRSVVPGLHPVSKLLIDRRDQLSAKTSPTYLNP